MAEDNKRSKLSLPDKRAGNSQPRHRTPLRGGSNPRAVREGWIGHGENGGDRNFHGRSNRSDSEGQRESYGERPQRFREDRPSRDDRRPRFGDRDEGRRRDFGDRRPRQDYEGRRDSYGDRPQRPRDDRPPRDERGPRFGDRAPNRERNFGERRPRPDFEGRRESYGERPQRFREDRPSRDDRRPRFGDRDEGRRGDFGDRRPRQDNEGRRDSYGDRPQRPRDDRPPRDERGPRFGDRAPNRERNFGERRPRPDFEGRRESYGDRPQRFREDHPSRDDRRPRFGDRDEGRRSDFGDRRPRQDYEGRRDSYRDRPQRSRDDRPSRNDHYAREGRDTEFRDRPRRDSHVRVYRADESQDAYTRFRERQARDEERPNVRPHEEERQSSQEHVVFDPANAPRQGHSFSRGRGSAPTEDDASTPQALHTEPDAPGSLRLSKRMSELGMCSRREADEYIERGWVKVDGEVVSELGHKVLPTQHIELDVIAEEMQMRRVTILINKPIGYVSGQAEDGYEPAVVLITAENHWEEDPVKRHFESRILHKLAPAGRLDIDSTGLLVLTQDGRVAKQIIGETSNVEKEYLVRVEGELIPDGLEMLRHGLELDGVELEPAKVSWQNEDQLRFVLHEGRKRQIRRMCELVGLHVVGLKRIRIGRIPLGKLPIGQWRYLDEHEEF